MEENRCKNIPLKKKKKKIRSKIKSYQHLFIEIFSPFEENTRISKSRNKEEKSQRKIGGDTPRVKCQTQRDKDLRSVPPPPPSYEGCGVLQRGLITGERERERGRAGQDAHRSDDALLCRETMVAVARPSRCREIVGRRVKDRQHRLFIRPPCNGI